VEVEAQRRGGVLFPARIVSLVQQPAVFRYFVIVEKLLGQGFGLKGKVLRLGIGQTIAAANVIEHSHGKPPPESFDGEEWLSSDEVRRKVILPGRRNLAKLNKPG
jgi:hypothetical protein